MTRISSLCLALMALGGITAAAHAQTRTLPPFEILTIVRSLDFEPTTQAARYGSTYRLRALDRTGMELDLAVDARSGRILAARQLAYPAPRVYGDWRGRWRGYGYGPRVMPMQPEFDDEEIMSPPRIVRAPSPAPAYDPPPVVRAVPPGYQPRRDVPASSSAPQGPVKSTAKPPQQRTVQAPVPARRPEAAPAASVTPAPAEAAPTVPAPAPAAAPPPAAPEIPATTPAPVQPLE